MIVGGCAAGSADRAPIPGAGISNDLGDKAFHFHRQAAELREMAKRLEMEAEYYAQQGGRDSELAKRSRDMAKDMWATAEEAERQARDYQSQLPHGRVY